MSAHPVSRWRHALCDDCWFTKSCKRDEDGMPIAVRMPIRIVESAREWEQCCRCGGMTFAGIYHRDDPSSRIEGQWEYGYFCSEGREARVAVEGGIR